MWRPHEDFASHFLSKINGIRFSLSAHQNVHFNPPGQSFLPEEALESFAPVGAETLG